MILKQLSLTACVAAISLGLGSASYAQTVSSSNEGGVAQAAKPEGALNDSDEIVVTGVRANLNQAVVDKRSADQVLDSLSLGDVGDLPTNNIADSLEFLPGVVGTRFRGSIDQISVRGLPNIFTQSTLNGRELSSGSGGRFVRYKLYPATFFDKAQISKSPLPNQVEGSIAGLIDLQTPSPVDARRSGVRADLRAQHAPFNESNGKIGSTGLKASLISTKKFKLGSGDSGFTVGFDYLDEPTVTALQASPQFSQASIGGENVILPNNIIFSNDTDDTKRYAGFGVWEWAGYGGTNIKLDAMMSQLDIKQDRTALLFALLNSPARYVTTEIDGGRLVSAETRSVLGLNRFEETDRSDTAKMLGVNIQHDFGNMEVEIDAYHSDTEVELDLFRPVFRTLNLAFDMEIDDGYRLSNFNKDLTDISNYGAHQNFALDRRINDKSQGLRFDVRKDIAGDLLSGVSFGARYSRREIQSQDIHFNDVSVRNAGLFPGLAIGSLDPSLASDPYIDFVLEQTNGIFPSPFLTFDFDAVREAFPDPVFTASNADLLNRSVDNTEETLAFYGRLDFATMIGNLPLSGVLGARYIDTKLTARGFSGTPVAVTSPLGAVTIEVPGDLSPVVDGNGYDKFLPSLNLKLEPTGSSVIRLGAARTLSRPDFLDLRLARNLSGGDIDAQPFRGSAGNPNLNPIVSDQIDLSFEWYPREGTAFTAGVYYKDVSGFVITDVREESIGGYQYELTSPINAESGEFYGVEMFFRHDLDWLPGPLDGLGFSAAATFNETTIDPQYSVLTEMDSVANTFIYDVESRSPGVEGFADRTATAIIFYEKGPISVRGSARHTSDRVRSVVTLNAPTVSRARTYLDVAASYRLTDNVKLQFQGLNLSGLSDDAYTIFNDYLGVNHYQGARYYGGVSVNF